MTMPQRGVKKKARRKLRQCPFCGNVNVTVAEVSRGVWDIRCKDDCILWNGFDLSFDSEHAAIAAWNKRYPR